MVRLSGASSLIPAARSGGYILGRSGGTWSLPPICSVSTPNYQALDNTKNQDPCQVAGDLLGTCFDVKKLGIPSAINELFNNPCLCNTVYYSLVYVCGLCTNTHSLEQSWSQYSTMLQCSPSDVTTYTHTIPPDTTIPPWAYHRLSDDKVDLQEAGLGGLSTTAGNTLSPPAPAPTFATSAAESLTASTAATVLNTSTAPITTTSASDTASSRPTSGTSGAARGDTGSVSPPASLPSSHPSSVPSTSSVFSPSPAENSRSLSGGVMTEADSTKPSASTPPGESHTTIGAPAPMGTTASTPQRRTHLGAILGGVFGGITAAILAVCIFLCLARRRRRRREKEAVLASGPLDWWQRSDRPPRTANREPSESSTIKADDLDYDDDTETLHAASVEKKSVTYGEYPDL